MADVLGMSVAAPDASTIVGVFGALRRKLAWEDAT